MADNIFQSIINKLNEQKKQELNGQKPQRAYDEVEHQLAMKTPSYMNNSVKQEPRSIFKKILQGKSIAVNDLLSSRKRDSEGKVSPEGDPNAREEKESYDVRSTSVDRVRYLPRLGLLFLKYKQGSKYYVFSGVSKSQFDEFMGSSSKGQYTEDVLRKQNYDYNWPRHRKYL